jgi:hypothetical protein
VGTCDVQTQGNRLLVSVQRGHLDRSYRVDLLEARTMKVEDTVKEKP